MTNAFKNKYNHKVIVVSSVVFSSFPVKQPNTRAVSSQCTCTGFVRIVGSVFLLRVRADTNPTSCADRSLFFIFAVASQIALLSETPTRYLASKWFSCQNCNHSKEHNGE